MERGKAWRGYPALSKPLTIMGVERRWFLLSATLGLAMWNAINSIVTGAVIFAVLYGVGFWAWKQDPNMLEILRASAKFRARYDPGKWAAAPWTLLIRRERMNVDNELMDFDAAGSLAEELPYWGWLDDERSCLTRAGELMSLARISPSVLDGQTPQQLDRVIERWQRMLSGLDARTRFYFYLLRRPVRFPEVPPNGASKVVTLGQRKRREFLTKRVQDVSAYVAWAYDPGLSTVASERAGPWWMAVAKNWMARRRNAQRSIYLHSSIEAASAAFRQTVDASRALVDDLTPLRLLQAHEASVILSELTNRPGTPWDGATGSGMNWRLAVSELEAERRNLRLDGEPVVLYSLLSPPGSARSNLLSDLYRLDATLTVTLEWRPQRLDSARRKIRGAQRHYFSKRYSMSAHVQETEGSAAAMVDTAAAAESDRLWDALVELETDGVAYGDLALTVAIHGPLEHTDSLDGDIRRIFASHDAKVIREGYGQLPAWFSRMPGQPRRRQVRSVFVSAGVAACMAPIFGPPVGTPKSAHLRAAAEYEQEIARREELARFVEAERQAQITFDAQQAGIAARVDSMREGLLFRVPALYGGTGQ